MSSYSGTCVTSFGHLERTACVRAGLAGLLAGLLAQLLARLLARLQGLAVEAPADKVCCAHQSPRPVGDHPPRE